MKEDVDGKAVTCSFAGLVRITNGIVYSFDLVSI